MTPSNRMAKIQNMDTSTWHAGEGTEKSLAAYGDADAWEHGLTVSYKTKNTLTVQSSNHAPWYLPPKIENICPH